MTVKYQGERELSLRTPYSSFYRFAACVAANARARFSEKGEGGLGGEFSLPPIFLP